MSLIQIYTQQERNFRLNLLKKSGLGNQQQI
jgi:hypothetical protein